MARPIRGEHTVKSQADGVGYNERLFSGGLRGRLHHARFHWFTTELRRHHARQDAVLELGCFDGKLIDVLPQRPSRYAGFDAGWEGGLDQAIATWKAHLQFRLSKATSPADGSPTRKGVFFLAKWLVKRLFSRDAQEYTPAELVNATLGRMSRVARREHKGFDYDALVQDIRRHFDVVDVAGHPLGFLPRWLCFGIGIVARSKPQQATDPVSRAGASATPR